MEAVEAEIFYAAAQAAEWVRSLASQRHGALVCENVAVLGAGRKEVTWPHWVLKNLYGPLGLMFGKFPEGEGNPPAPVTFIPVRVAVRPRDPRFLRDTPELAVTVANSADDGRDVLSGLPHDWTEIKQWAHNLLPKQ
ncbi:hypothetical protein [Streptomyces sp. NPDC001816]|uniref:hypothetical protein n=1 Tax=Streptomyces sp. NPDC001816 TaxID=3364612 RepID=UPI00369A4FB6